MSAAIDVVELVGVEAEVAVGGEMHEEDDYRCTPEEKRAPEAIAPLLFSQVDFLHAGFFGGKAASQRESTLF
jgi:hypothetical protein